jgi:hypothetical protein
MYPKEPFQAIRQPVTAEDIAWFSEELSKINRFIGMHWLLSAEPAVAALPAPTVEGITLGAAYAAAADKKDFVLRHIQMSTPLRQEIEVLTRGQGKNPFWGLYRKGRITASNFGPVIKFLDRKTKHQPCKSLMKTLLGDYDISGVKAIQWGLQHEATAIQLYEQAFGVKVTESGIWMHPTGTLGASPDGLVDDSKMIEVCFLFVLLHRSQFFICF